LASTLTSKGDLLTMDSGPSFSRLAVGTNGLPLIADSSESNGLKWAQISTAGIADGAITAAKLGLGSGQIVQSYSEEINPINSTVAAASEGTFYSALDFTPLYADSTIVIICNLFASMESLRQPAIVTYRGTVAAVPGGGGFPADFTRIYYDGSSYFNSYAVSGQGAHTSDYDVASVAFTVVDQPGVAEPLRYGWTFFNHDSVTRTMKISRPITPGSINPFPPYPQYPMITLNKSNATFLEISA